MDDDVVSDRQHLAEFENLGPAAAHAEEIFALVGRGRFFSDLDRDDVAELARYMTVYGAPAGQPLIREGEIGDYMMFLLTGEVDIVKRGGDGTEQHMTWAGPGTTIGEMSMIDGEPRFASCVAIVRTTFAVLLREDMSRILAERPQLGAKILVKLVRLLSRRLRQTSEDLLRHLRREQAAG